MDGESQSLKTAQDFAIVVDEGGENAQLAALLGAEIAARFAARAEAPFALIMRDGDGALIAGLNGVTHWRWLYVRHLWVNAAQRGRGLGGALIAAAEARARARDCVGAYVDTFDAGAAAFYARCGFARVGEIEDFPPGARRIFLCKKLAAQR